MRLAVGTLDSHQTPLQRAARSPQWSGAEEDGGF